MKDAQKDSRYTEGRDPTSLNCDMSEDNLSQHHHCISPGFIYPTGSLDHEQYSESQPPDANIGDDWGDFSDMSHAGTIPHSRPACFHPLMAYSCSLIVPEQATPSDSLIPVINSNEYETLQTLASADSMVPHLPRTIWEQRGGNDRELACPLFLAGIIAHVDPQCDNKTFRNMYDMYDHINKKHQRFVEACKNCKQVFTSPEQREVHVQRIGRCCNKPFRKRGPNAVQAQWEAVYRALNPSIPLIPNACKYSMWALS